MLTATVYKKLVNGLGATLCALSLCIVATGPLVLTPQVVQAQAAEREFCNDPSVSDDAKIRANCPGFRNTGVLGDAGDLGIPDVEADQRMLDQVLRTVFVITGALATIFVIIGGFKYVISAGNPEGAKSAKNTIVSALIGLVISVFAYAIVNFVISKL